jgi:predicted site-specific integrase-resolvase
MNDEQKYITPRDAAKLHKVTTSTIRYWESQGKFSSFRTQGGHRRYLLSDILELFESKPSGGESIDLPKKRRICYCRVSSNGQKKDLESQVEFFERTYPDYEIIRDIGSGINFKRKGFNSILDSAIEGNISEIVVTHRDRFCRFGFDLFERIIKEYSNGQIVVLNKKETSPEQELVDDLISIVTVFSSRIYGSRSHSVKNKIKDLISKEKEESDHHENIKVETISN